MTTWSTCCWRTRSHPLLRCTTGIYRRWDSNSWRSGGLICWLEATDWSITQIHSAAPAGEVRRLAERQHGEPLQRLRQLVLRTIWKQSEVLDHLQQPVGTSGWGGTVRSLSCQQMQWLCCLVFQSIAVEGYETGEHAPGLKLKGTGAYKAAHHIIKVRRSRDDGLGPVWCRHGCAEARLQTQQQTLYQGTLSICVLGHEIVVVPLSMTSLVPVPLFYNRSAN